MSGDIVMTANQLALASLREDVRHSQAMEGETQRHNTESEAIQKEANDINKLAQENLDRREQMKIMYDKEYKDAYIKYLNASEDWKEHYEGVMADITARDKESEAEYRYWDSIYKRDRNELEKRKIKNDETYTQAWKDTQMINAALENKRIEYNATLQREGYDIQRELNNIKAQELRLTEWRDTSNYLLGMEKVSQGWRDLQIRNELTQWNMKQIESQINLNDQLLKESKNKVAQGWVTSISKAINSTALSVFRGLDLFNPFGGGYGKISPEEEFRKLFQD